MEKELAALIKADEAKCAYYIGVFYGKIKTSERLTTFYGSSTHLNEIVSLLGFYVSRRGEDYVCVESIKLSNLISEHLPNVIKNWEFHTELFRSNFLNGYRNANTVEMKLGSGSFSYIKGKKRILKDLHKEIPEISYIVKMSRDYVLYIVDSDASLKDVDDFNANFNISSSDQYKAIIGLLIGDGHLKKYDYIQITHTDPQKDYILFLKRLFDFWGFNTTIGQPSNTGRLRKDGSAITNYYYYIRLNNKKYFKGRVSLTNKQVNSYLASRLNRLSLLFWYLDDGSYTPTGINFHTNGFDKLSQNMLIKYLSKNFGITPKIYTDQNGNHFLHLSMKDSERFLELMKDYIPFLPDCFKDKFDKFDNPLCII